MNAWWVSSNLMRPTGVLGTSTSSSASRIALRSASPRLLDGLLDGGRHRVAERDGGEAAVDAHRHLPALEPLLLPRRVERGRPVGGLHEAVGDRRGVAHLVEELDGGHAAAREELLGEPELAELAHEHAALAGQHDQQHRLRVGALHPGQHRPVVGLAAVEELGATPA